MAVYEGSRYTFSTGLVDADGALVLTVPEPYLYRPFADNIPHEVISGDTWDSIAGLYYSGAFPDPAGYAWAISDFQIGGPALDPTLAPTVGTIVIVPSVRTVREEILNELRRTEVPG